MYKLQWNSETDSFAFLSDKIIFIARYSETPRVCEWTIWNITNQIKGSNVTHQFPNHLNSSCASYHSEASHIRKRYCRHFFTQVHANSNVIISKCGWKKKRTGSSHANLDYHFNSAYHHSFALINTKNDIIESKISEFFTKIKGFTIYVWFDLSTSSL